tara:strand:- start:127 stop:378 length:252 start_codon:yes stop_codon:yes gene_type:complete
MTIFEKYPENIPWDQSINNDKSINTEWMLTKEETIYIFSKSRINEKYVYIQKNKEKKEVFSEYKARLTYQRLFDEGYLLALVA